MRLLPTRRQRRNHQVQKEAPQPPPARRRRAFFLPVVLLATLFLAHMNSERISVLAKQHSEYLSVLRKQNDPVTTRGLHAASNSNNATNTTTAPIIERGGHLNILKNNESVAVCMMFFDDNHYLIEWLAYHYHVLPLRRLIIHPDPKSKTSPIPILKRWDGMINYTIYDFLDVYPKGKERDYQYEHARTLWRQRDFLTKCMRQLKEEGSKWIIITDVDEYTHVNVRARNKDDPMYNFGYDDTTWTVSSQKEVGSVLAVLEHGQATNSQYKNFSNPNHYHLGDPCVGINRKDFGGQEYCAKPKHNSNYTWHFNLSSFATHRWRHYKKPWPIGKMMLDLERIPMANVSVKMVHRPVESACGVEKAWGRDDYNPLVAYHYSGTLEQETFRTGDHWEKNRTERYIKELKTNRGIIAPSDITEWLDGFVESVGIEEAQRLLKHAGKVEEAASL